MSRSSKWSRIVPLRQQQRTQRPPRALRTVEALEERWLLAVNALTYHGDIASTGLNASETALTPANVKVGSFGKLFATQVDGQVYAEPLVDTGVTIAAGPFTSAGMAGVHNVVFVATEHDSLYAIDSNSTGGGAVLWKRSFLDTSVAANNTLGATAIAPLLSADLNTTDITPEIGITGTPVIDANTNTLYVVAKTKETISGVTHFVQRLHAINLADGTDRVTPYLIGDTTGTNTNNTQIYVYGSGDGHVTDPYNGTGKQVVQFNALRENERGALNFVNNTVYVEWASHGDNGPYHGWVAKWDVTNLSTSGFTLSGVFNTSPNNGLAGVWQGSGRLAFEANGSAFYFVTGNGSGGAPTLNAQGFPSNANYNEALVKMVADTTTSRTNQNSNGWGLKVADYFTPYNLTALDGADSDFGSGGVMLLPDSAGIAGHPHLMVAAGKEGKIYLVDRDNLGHFDPNNDHVVNAVPDGSGHNTSATHITGSMTTAAYFNNQIYWVSAFSGPARAYQISSAGILSLASQTAISSFGYLPGSVIVSANGTTNGIAWVMDRNANVIHAYDASTMATELWNSGQKAGGGDNLGTVVKFASPTVANGEVFVGTSNSIVVYGLTQAVTAVPNPPTLSAAALSGSSINLTWTDTTAAPNTATGYSIEKSTDNVNFSVATTVPAGSTAVAIGGLQPTTTYYFRIRGFNSFGGTGYSPYSNTASATTTTATQGPVLDFSSGFATATSKLTLNGSTALSGSRLRLTTSGVVGQAGSAFSTSPVDVTKFNTQFTFQLTAGASTGDGFTFTIQAAGPKALGASGGGLGFGIDPGNANSAPGIPTSVALKFDLFSNAGEGPDSTGLYLKGAAPTLAGSQNLTPSGVNLHTNDIFQVNLSYDGTTLTEIIKDTVTNQTATFTYAVNIPGTLGTGSGYVGFTGGTGGATVTSDILSWTYSPTATVSPNAPSGLGATAASASSVNLIWTNNATSQSGFHLDRATDSAFTQNLITQNLPATPNSFADNATGLAPGGTFYYRLRAFNSVGDSGNSNVASVAIPLAPPKPTLQQVTAVTTTEIDMSWQDNAGHQADSYQILRAVNHGAFTTVASLPPTSRTAPSTYTWADTNLTPGTYYEYHIEAVNVSGNNDFAGVNATTLTLPPTLIANPGNGVVTLSWSAPAGAATYNLYRGLAAGGESTTPYVSGLTTASYSDTGVTNGSTYYYVVTAVNSNVAPLASESARSNESVATPGVGPAAPTNVTATGTPINTGTASTTVTWTAVAGAATYNIYRGATAGGESATPLATGITTASYTDRSVAFGTPYYYTVTAVAGTESAQSSEVHATPALQTYVNFTATGGDPATVAGITYLNDVGLVYGARGNALTFGWNLNSSTNSGRDRNVSNSPNELYDSFSHMQKDTNPNAFWGIAVPNGTYQVHLIAGDPSFFDSTYKINISGGTVSGGVLTPTNAVLAINGTPTATAHWLENTVTVTITQGVLYVSNATGSQNNKIDEIDILQSVPAAAKALVLPATTTAASTQNSSRTTAAPAAVVSTTGSNQSASNSAVSSSGSHPSTKSPAPVPYTLLPASAASLKHVSAIKAVPGSNHAQLLDSVWATFKG